jgi:chorismate dehydratase
MTSTGALTTEPALHPPIRLGAIEFVNTLPIYLGLDRFAQPGQDYDLTYGPPSMLNELVGQGHLDVSPVSSAYYLRHQSELVLLDNLSVSSWGSVESVLLLSPCELSELGDQPIYVPDASETSVALLAYLLAQAELGDSTDVRSRLRIYPAADYPTLLAQKKPLLIIGDNALRIQQEPQHEGYRMADLAQWWLDQTRLPFVFAVWVARRDWLNQSPDNTHRLEALTTALQRSRENFFSDKDLVAEAVALTQARCPIPEAVVMRYFTRSLNYLLQSPHRQALHRFYHVIQWMDANQLEEALS